MAEEGRDIDGLIATLTDDCVYEIVPTLEVQILFPWDPERRLFSGERIWFDRGAVARA